MLQVTQVNKHKALLRVARLQQWSSFLRTAQELLTNEGTARTTVVTQSHAAMLSPTLTPHRLPSA